MPPLPPDSHAGLAGLGDDWIRRIESAPLPGLNDQPVDLELAEAISGLTDTTWSNVSAQANQLLISGLWLLAGDLDRSHDISQRLASPEGSFLHGIMHRREGDFGNAKYWFRKAGNHRVIDQLIADDRYVYLGSCEFVDSCEQATNQANPDKIKQCKETQWAEWVFLMNFAIVLRSNELFK